jgi:acetyl esterase/lipase
MTPRAAALSLMVALLAPAAACAVGDYPPRIDGARVETYKTVGDITLKLWILSPKQAADEPRPAIVFFFGGGWKSGSPQQFEPQCRHLAQQGMVAITADYRVASRHAAKPVDCLADARSAIRWVRSNAARLGIDPDRIAAGGGSAGGHLAAATAFIDAFDEPAEDRGVSAAPNALVLFNPALVLAPLPGLDLAGFGTRVAANRLGTEAKNLSPAHHVKPDGPPTMIFHGSADETVPLATAEAFAAVMRKAGNRCELVTSEGQPHGFFNREPWRSKTIVEADAFLESLGWLDVEIPTVIR